MTDGEYLDYRSAGLSFFSCLYFLAIGGGLMIVFGLGNISVCFSITFLILASISFLRRTIFFVKNLKYISVPRLIVETLLYLALFAGVIIVGTNTRFVEQYFDYYWLAILGISLGFIIEVILMVGSAKDPTSLYLERNKYNPPVETNDIF